MTRNSNERKPRFSDAEYRRHYEAKHAMERRRTVAILLMALAGVLPGNVGVGQVQGTAGQASFAVQSLTARMEDRPPTILEHPRTLEIKSSYFSVCATLQVRLPANEQWRIGFIQQIDARVIRIDHSTAYLTCELPQFPYCDADHKANAPWCTKSNYPLITGTGATMTLETAIQDDPSTKTPWKEQLPNGQAGKRPDLRAVRRSQQFTTWLVARRERDGRIVVLKRIRWEIGFSVTVDPNKPLGLRAVANPLPVRQPIVDDANRNDPSMRIPDTILSARQSANEDEQLWWNPKSGNPGQRTRLNINKDKGQP